MKVYIVRHGEVLSNVLKKYNALDEDLTEFGMKQVLELKEKIKNINFDIIISSPLQRAKHTAEILNNNDTRIIFDLRIKERDCGNLSGQSFKVTDREEYWNYYTNTQYGTSENIQIFFRRVYDFLEELQTKKYKSVLIVTHSGVSKAVDGYFIGIQDGKFLKRGLKNGEIKQYLKQEDKFYMESEKT